MRNLTVEEVLKWDARLKAVPRNEWPRLCNELNYWKWPEELGDPPEDLDLNSRHMLHPVINMLMQSITLSCGEKACLRYVHTTELGKTDQEFDDWWDSIKVEKQIQESNDNGNYGRGGGAHIEDYCLAITFFTLGFALCVLLIALIRFFAK